MRNLTEEPLTEQQQIIDSVGSGNLCALAIAYQAQMPIKEANRVIKGLYKAGVLSKRVNTDWTLSREYIRHLKQENARLNNSLNLAA